MAEVRRLRVDDDRASFDSGQPDLDRFLRETAAQHLRRSISVTWVVEVEGRIAGFATVGAAAMTAPSLAFDPRKWPRNHLPVLRLARLATDRRFTGRGIGRALVRFAMKTAIDMRDRVGCVAMVVDAKRDAVGFYATLGFGALPVAPSHGGPVPMLMSVETIAAAMAAGARE